MPGALRRFSPAESLDSLESIQLADLWDAGKRLILLDVDNTLLPWRSTDIPDSTLAWLAEGKRIGFQFCALSNTRNPARLQELCSRMGIESIRDKFKPSPRMYVLALERFGVSADGAVMVGDQLLTDVLGANRSGIDAIWVRPLARHEFVGTRLVSRNIERVVGKLLYGYFQAGDDQGPHPPERPGLFEHNIVREFAKFVIVGGSSTVIDLGLHFWLMHGASWGGVPVVESVGRWALAMTGSAETSTIAVQQAAVGPLKVGPVLLAILNSFYWNSRWTFRVADDGEHGKRLVKFFVIALIGMLINVMIVSTVYRYASGGDAARWSVASLVGMVIVVFWNFFAQRYWTFRKKQ